jgi:hypothetical protein
MPKPEKRPTPPDHRVYPRGATPKAAPKPAADGGRRAPSAWTRDVPQDRAFPRA